MQIYIPTEGADDWKRLLAKPDLHWKAGHSAMALARCWEEYKARGGPPEVNRMLYSLPFLLAIPEFKVDLPPAGGRPSQTDLFVLACESEGLVAISVEGKVDEPFGPTLEERRADSSPGVQERIAFLLKTLKLPPDISGTIRYQLLHRTVAALRAARDFQAYRAVMLVHSFSRTSKWFDDFKAFAGLFGLPAEPGMLLPVDTFDGVELEIGWCAGEERFLQAPG
jgi:hypothetical protein